MILQVRHEYSVALVQEHSVQLCSDVDHSSVNEHSLWPTSHHALLEDVCHHDYDDERGMQVTLVSTCKVHKV